MKILENPNPIPTHILVCENCKCKFEYSDKDIVKNHYDDSNGRIGGTHYWSNTEYINCPNCDKQIIISRQSGYGSSIIDDVHITRDYHI